MPPSTITIMDIIKCVRLIFLWILIITAHSICVYSVFIIYCSDCSQFRKKWDRTLARKPRVGKLQMWLPGVEYLLRVMHKVDNQQMHKSLQLNYTRANWCFPTMLPNFFHVTVLFSRGPLTSDKYVCPYTCTLAPSPPTSSKPVSLPHHFIRSSISFCFLPCK